MELTTLSMAVGAFFVVISLFLARWQRHAVSRPLPPGPKGLPFLGSTLRLLSCTNLSVYFQELVRDYGGLVMLRLPSSNILVIGDGTLAQELLERRSSKYSSRSEIPFIRNHVDPNQTLWVLASDPEVVAPGRRLATQSLRPVRKGEARGLLEHEALVMSHQLLTEPLAWMRHMERLPMSIGLTLGFGTSYPLGTEPQIKLLSEVIALLTPEVLGLATSPDNLINACPFFDQMPLIPKPWRAHALKIRQKMSALIAAVQPPETARALPIKTWQKTFSESGAGAERMVSLLLGLKDATMLGLQESVFVALMYPSDFVAAAQRQLDTVVGPDRMPTLDDIPNLPCVEAFVRETLRYRAPAPIGVAHAVSKDDIVEYKGQQYFIPAGTTVLAPPSIIDHDPLRYPEPDRFNPWRHLDSEGRLLPKPSTAVFGYGKRVCPGIPLAEQTLRIAVATLLWLFDLRKVPGFSYREGEEAYKEGDLFSRLLPFPVDFEPRDARRAEVVRRNYHASPKDAAQLF